nr:hypothetical protein [Candidatus Neomarinimicrobiota bacterium]
MGRLSSLSILKTHFSDEKNKAPVYWFHAASHGEYEQIRPVIKGLKDVEPTARILVSFFSPSGFNHVKDDNIECKVYLPFDFPWTITRALKIVNPKKLIFAAYDIWPNLVWMSKSLNIKTTLFAVRFVKGTKKLSPILRNFYASVYHCFTEIFTVTKSDHDRLLQLLTGPIRPDVQAFGNPRYDQVKSHADDFTAQHTESVLSRKKCLIAGSVHREDEEIIRSSMINLLNKFPKLSLIWVPHEPDEKTVSDAVSFFKGEQFETSVMNHNKVNQIGSEKVIVVATVGVLSKLYWNGQVAYVGGGFSAGVHNVMEPAIARLPVFFGPNYAVSHAAEELIEAKGGFTISSGDELQKGIETLLQSDESLIKSSYEATGVIHRNLGSATRVVRGIIKN